MQRVKKVEDLDYASDDDGGSGENPTYLPGRQLIPRLPISAVAANGASRGPFSFWDFVD